MLITYFVSLISDAHILSSPFIIFQSQTACALAVFEFGVVCSLQYLVSMVQSELLQCKQNGGGFGFSLAPMPLKTLFPQSSTFDCYCTKGRAFNLGERKERGGWGSERLHYQD